MNLKSLILQSTSITAEDLEKVEALVVTGEKTFLEGLEDLGKVEESVLLDILSKFYKTPKIDLGAADIHATIIGLIPSEMAHKYKIIPIDRAGNHLIVATSDPHNLEAMDTIRFKVGYHTKAVLASGVKIGAALERYYGKLDLTNIKDNRSGVSSGKENQGRQTIGNVFAKDDGPIVQIVNDLLIQCLRRRASDIHFESYENLVRVRMRIDGALVEIAKPPISMRAALISRIKIMAGLNIAESRLPQDGAINITIGEKPIDFRVNSLPTANGEKIVMRILDKSNLQIDMTALGFEQDQLGLFKEAIAKPHGMVLVTGPTGSGKTTTLYSALNELNKEDVNIMTAEDPVEYNLSGINQVQMRSDIGLDFAAALRAFLRQDPDIIMVGEIRDLETAEIAIKAALTGHLVFSTLHTNSASDTISRLLNMGVAGFNLVSALNCITAQRLARRICARCKIEDTRVTKKTLLELGIPENYLDKVKASVGKGCAACQGSGSKGRIAIHEVMLMNDPIRTAILEGHSVRDIKQAAMRSGMRSLRQSALTKMVHGILSVEEVLKSTMDDNS